jgi:hypothetical protein
MARDFGLIGPWSHAGWVNYLFFVLATLVQFYTGADHYLDQIGQNDVSRHGAASFIPSWPPWPYP